MHNSMASPIAQSFQITSVNLATNDLAYNFTTQEYLASVSSTAGFGIGNTITRISNQGQIVQSTFVGSEPGIIALSSDGTTGYVALKGSPSVRQFDAITGAAGIQFGLGSTWNGAMYAEDIAVAPGQNDTIAVARRNSCCSPRHEGVAIYKNGVMLPATTPSHTGSNTIEFGANASTLYGYNNETSDFGFRTMSVNASGVSITTLATGAFYGYSPTITYDGGLMYSNDGRVVDPTNGLLLGTFNIGYGSVFASAAKWGHAYALSSSGVLTVFDQATFTPITTYSLGNQLNVGSGLSELIVGDNGDLAVRTTDRIYLLSAVPEPSTYFMWMAGFVFMALGVRKHRTR